MADNRELQKAKLKLLEKRSPEDEFIFPLNPNEVQRSLAPQYADSPVVGADYSAALAPGNPVPFQWVRNRPEDIRISFLLIPPEALQTAVNLTPFGGALDLDVETELAKLDRFMQKDPRTGQPPDLVFVFGPRVDRVRIFTKDVQEKLWTPQLRVQQAIVRLGMRTVRHRSS